MGPTMIRDCFTEEIREIRHRLAAQFDYDVNRIGEDLRGRQAVSGRRIVQLLKRPPRNVGLPNKAAQPNAPIESSVTT